MNSLHTSRSINCPTFELGSSEKKTQSMTRIDKASMYCTPQLYTLDQYTKEVSNAQF